MDLTKSDIENAAGPQPWDFTNDVLYTLCRKNPKHTCRSIIIAKVRLIGRSYAAAIERRRGQANKHNPENFYISKVAPAFIQSSLDTWINSASEGDQNVDEEFIRTVTIHFQMTELLKQITGMKNRSLASKYLHFHVPDRFFIYDTIAVRGLNRLGDIPDIVQVSSQGDHLYASFLRRCLALRALCHQEFTYTLTTRQIDNLLLAQGRRPE